LAHKLKIKIINSKIRIYLQKYSTKLFKKKIFNIINKIFKIKILKIKK